MYSKILMQLMGKLKHLLKIDQLQGTELSNFHFMQCYIIEFIVCVMSQIKVLESK